MTQVTMRYSYCQRIRNPGMNQFTLQVPYSVEGLIINVYTLLKLFSHLLVARSEYTILIQIIVLKIANL